jgi:biopolymer transport protein ExbD
MAHGAAGDGVDAGRLDLVPMIDCIMLLLIFFVMTTKFSTDEKAISSLLPTDKGQSGPGKAKDIKMVNICIYPASPRMVKGYQPSEYAAELKKLTNNNSGLVIEDVYMRVGQREPIQINGKVLTKKEGERMVAEVERVHQYLGDELKKFENAGEPRNKQNDVVIHCYSGLSWKYALIAYDAVRNYEGQNTADGFKWTGDPRELDQARSVNFAPPRIRNYDKNELGNELYEIIHMK